MIYKLNLTVPEHLLPAIINGDESGLGEDGLRQLARLDREAQEFVDGFGLDENMEGPHWHYTDVADSLDEFGENDLGGLRGRTVEVEVVVVLRPCAECSVGGVTYRLIDDGTLDTVIERRETLRLSQEDMAQFRDESGTLYLQALARDME